MNNFKIFNTTPVFLFLIFIFFSSCVKESSLVESPENSVQNRTDQPSLSLCDCTIEILDGNFPLPDGATSFEYNIGSPDLCGSSTIPSTCTLYNGNFNSNPACAGSSSNPDCDDDYNQPTNSGVYPFNCSWSDFSSFTLNLSVIAAYDDCQPKLFDEASLTVRLICSNQNSELTKCIPQFATPLTFTFDIGPGFNNVDEQLILLGGECGCTPMLP